MKASGLSAHQVLAPLFLTALGVAVVSFAFNERVVTRATATLSAWQAAEYGPVPREAGARSNVYLRDGDNILLAASLAGTGKAMVMEGVTWYRRDKGGMIVEQVRSPRATYAAPGWRLEQPVRFDVASTTSTAVKSFVVGQEATPGQIRTLTGALSAVRAPSSTVTVSVQVSSRSGCRAATLDPV